MKNLSFMTTLVEDDRNWSQKSQEKKISFLALIPLTKFFKQDCEFNSWNEEAHCVTEEILLFVT